MPCPECVERAERDHAELVKRGKRIAELEHGLSWTTAEKHSAQASEERIRNDSYALRQRAELAEARAKELEKEKDELERYLREQEADNHKVSEILERFIKKTLGRNTHGWETDLVEIQAHLAALISAAEPILNWPAVNYDDTSYRIIPASAFSAFVDALEQAKQVQP